MSNEDLIKEIYIINDQNDILRYISFINSAY